MYSLRQQANGEDLHVQEIRRPPHRRGARATRNARPLRHRCGRAHTRKLLYARILLEADADGPDRWTDERTAEALEVPTATAARVRLRFCEDGLEVALMPKKPGRPRRRVLDGRAEAHLVALSCSDPPEGREHWSMRLLADRMVELGHVEALSHETVRRTLKKTASSPTSSASG